jgi:hypothetical protein
MAPEQRGSIAGEINCLLAWNDWLTRPDPALLADLHELLGPELEPLYGVFKAGWTEGVHFLLEEIAKNQPEEPGR